MTTVFIAGSISISRLHEKVQERIGKIVTSDLSVVVGDADGADTSIQRCLQDYHATKVTVYCTGETPRNNLADWPVCRVRSTAPIGTRAYFTAKDLEMARRSDYGLMIWDCKSTGTLSNVIELLKNEKKSVVFVNKSKNFATIADNADLDHLLQFMSEHARIKADEKIGLSAKISELNQKHLAFAHPNEEQPYLKQPFAAVETPAADSGVGAGSMKLRSELMSVLTEHIHRTHLNQSEAAKAFGVTQPRISDLTRGKVDLFGLDALVNMATLAGLEVEMHVRKAT